MADDVATTSAVIDDLERDLGQAPQTRPWTRRPARRILSFIAGFLVVVIGAELGVRIVHHRLTEPDLYFSDPATIDVKSMNKLAAHGIRSDLTFVGTSMVRRDIDPNLVEKQISGVNWAHNVALPGAQTTIIDRWLLQEVVPRLHPKQVVWGISSLDFNSGRPDHPIDQYNQARATERGFYGDADRVMTNLDLSLYRDSLRDPYKLYQAYIGNAKKLVDKRSLSVLATEKLYYKPLSPAALLKLKKNHFKTVRDKQLHNFRIGTDEIASYKHVITSLQKEHIPLTIVIMPVTTAYLKAHPHGAADYLRWKATVTSVARSYHVTVIDVSRSMPDSAFHDVEHLFVPQAKQFTKMLSAKLRAAGV